MTKMQKNAGSGFYLKKSSSRRGQDVPPMYQLRAVCSFQVHHRTENTDFRFQAEPGWISDSYETTDTAPLAAFYVCPTELMR